MAPWLCHGMDNNVNYHDYDVGLFQEKKMVLAIFIEIFNLI